MISRSEYLTTPDGVMLHSLRWGPPSRPHLVLLHGGGANAHWWDHLAPVLAERFCVTALDFRGHGDSSYPSRLEVGSFRRDLEALLAHLGSPDPILMGHSMGAGVALEYAAGGGSPRALVLVDIARGGSPRQRRATRLALTLGRAYRTREDAVARYRFLPPAPLASEELRRHVAEHSVREEPDGRFGFKFDARWFGLRGGGGSLPLERVACPVLIIRGRESPLLTPEGAAELVAELPDARLVEIEGAGHNVHVERPDEVVAAALDFLV